MGKMLTIKRNSKIKLETNFQENTNRSCRQNVLLDNKREWKKQKGRQHRMINKCKQVPYSRQGEAVNTDYVINVFMTKSRLPQECLAMERVNLNKRQQWKISLVKI